MPLSHKVNSQVDPPAVGPAYSFIESSQNPNKRKKQEIYISRWK